MLGKQFAFVWRRFSMGLLHFWMFYKQTHWLSSRWSFQWYLYSKQLWKVETVSPPGAKSRHDLWTSVMGSGSLSSGFLSWKTTHCVCRCHLAFFMLSNGDRVSGIWHKKNAKTQLLLRLWITKSFVSEPVVLCLLPALKQLHQVNLLAYKKGKISDSS